MEEDFRMVKYHQYCPVARACEVIADRWTPLIVRELLFGSRRCGN
jgi:DNA-binding HxlR family transcriptional regulator